MSKECGPCRIESEQGSEYTQVAFGLKMLTIIVQRTAFKELTDRQNGGYQNEEAKVDGKRKAKQQPSGPLDMSEREEQRDHASIT